MTTTIPDAARQLRLAAERLQALIVELRDDAQHFENADNSLQTQIADKLESILALQGHEAGAVIPENMVLVPKQWTSEMAHAGYMVYQHKDIACAECGAIYAAMIKEYCK